MTFAKSNPNTDKTAKNGKLSREPQSNSETHVDISPYQRLDSRQLNALLSQHKIEVPADTDDSGKIRAAIEHHVSCGDVLVGSGTLQVLPDGFGFLRSRWFNYLGSPDDIYVSPSQIRKFRLTNGDLVSGQIRPPKDNERFFALLRVQSVNQLEPERASDADDFDDLKALVPNVPVELGKSPNTSCQIVDLIAPVGFGQRCVVVGPPRSGKTRLIRNLCEGFLAAHNEVYAFVLLIDQRPEEITELENTLNGDRCEVISSVMDNNSQRHNDVAMMVLSKAKRMVELGENVAIFLDSLTNLASFELGPGFSASQLESDSLTQTRSFLADAKRTENAGTLTIISTLTVDSNNELDEPIARILRNAANLEIQLDSELVKRRIWPAIDLHQSQSQQEETLLGKKYEQVCKLRRLLCDKSLPEAMDWLLAQLKESGSDDAWLNKLG